MLLADADPDGRLSQLSYGGVTYDADSDGHVEVPETVGRVLARFPHLRVWTGPAEPTAEEAAAAEKASLLSRVAELEAALAAKAKPADSGSEKAPRGAKTDK